MKPYLQDPDFTLYQGDVREVLRELPDESVDCVVTSPPYWGLRDYGTGRWEGGAEDCDHLQKVGGTDASTLGAASGGNDMSDEARERSTSRSFVAYADTCGKCGALRVDNQIGLEASPFDYVLGLVEVFEEVRRLLVPTGTLWLNLGDSYTAKARGSDAGWETSRLTNPGTLQKSQAAALRQTGDRHRGKTAGLREKNLAGMPWRVAFALQEAGWNLRADIVWSKPNPMPESVTDRPTKSHEYVFLLAKSPRYFFDQDAVREPFEVRPQQRLTPTSDQPLGPARIAAGIEQGNVQGGTHVSRFRVQEETLDGSAGEAARGPDGRRKTTRVEDGNAHPNYANAYGGERWPNDGRNVRSVWTIATVPFPGAHFAVFPPELARRCILAGTSERGRCRDCGAPWERELEGGEGTYDERKALGYDHPANMKVGVHEGHHNVIHPPGYTHDLTPQARATIGWLPTCDCGTEPVPCVVLDPFAGAGTTAHVARSLGRCSVGVELNPGYCEMIANRLGQQSLFAETAA